MEVQSNVPTRCPSCSSDLLVTRLQCSSCGTEITGRYSLEGLARLREPYASLIELFLRARGNIKELERILGLSYPTVRARLEEALAAAGFDRPATQPDPSVNAARKAAILDELERGVISSADAAARLRSLKKESML
jgi:hypothetical protein